MQSKNAPPPTPPRRRGERKLLLGITGGIGSGKSLASRFFQSQGYTVIYADIVAKLLYDRNAKLKARLVSEFGKGILGEDGKISSMLARKIILTSKKNVKRVNSIVHPFVRKEIDKRIKRINDHVIFVEAAIMFDTGYYKEMDYTLLIYTPKEIRIKRVLKRDNISRTAIEKLMSLQMDERKKRNLADFIIKNNGSERKFLESLEIFSSFLHTHMKKTDEPEK